ncbi:hypothetical protein ACHAW5_011222 [Stephanodiscus triporus]|uniref:Uncharacterized protein n=1 Tax=Stephanodiscus triporus TaxID=2934178 RepID=A0ABD3PDN0_9STRA
MSHHPRIRETRAARRLHLACLIACLLSRRHHHPLIVVVGASSSMTTSPPRLPASSSALFLATTSSSPTALVVVRDVQPGRRRRRDRPIVASRVLFPPAAMTSDDDDDGVPLPPTTTTRSSSSSRSARDRGVYSRPSGAIERGSGFFVPGLEGSRVRLVFGLVVVVADVALAMTSASSGSGGTDDPGRAVSAFLAAIYGALLLLQGSVEMGVEGGRDVEGNDDDDDRGGIVVAGVDGDDDDDDLGPVRRMARAIVALTPAAEFRFVAEEYGVLYSFGAAGGGDDDDYGLTTVGGIGIVTDSAADDDERRLATLALDAASTSRGGERVALPRDHPSSIGLLPAYATRAVLVQRTDDYRGSRTCVVIGSDRPLPAFTKNDLRWIGRLAIYCNLMMMEKIEPDRTVV